ncbi:MAG: DUF3854 domain-containing protein [Planctomycetales bacterium]|nr:DUF3854 domain-containing protein [Planctomycetales bacterium]
MTLLLPHHRTHLHLSGLSDASIADAGFYSETDPAAVMRLLRWQRPAVELGACLILPFFHGDGSRNGFARIRPDRPRADGDGVVKYEQPRGVSPRVYFPPAAAAAIADVTQALGITEGEKKSLAATQVGCPCVGLCGVWSWQKPGSKTNGDRELIADLAAIQWRGRAVWLCFDTDEKRNPNVNFARAELARVLTDLGARVVFVDLPHGPRDADGLPGKVGVDDEIVARGEVAFRQLVQSALEGDGEPRPLEDWRRDLAAARLESVGTPGICLDRSPPGAGKSTADLPAMEAAGTSLTVVPAHYNCRETEAVYAGAGLAAAAYPQLSEGTCQNITEALAALGCGLAASQSVCPDCKFRNDCDYQTTMKAAEASPHRITTHARAALSFEQLAAGRSYVAIHEDAAGLLRPTKEIRVGFEVVARVAEQAKNTAWEWGDIESRGYFWAMESAALWLAGELSAAEDTTELQPPAPITNPPHVDRQIWRAIQTVGERPDGDTTRICRAIAAGELFSIAIRVDKILRPGGEADTRKSILAVWQTRLPTWATVWLNDATADAQEIESLTGEPVIDRTPAGHLARQHAAIQVAHLDVKKSTRPAVVVKILRAALSAFPQFERVGVIADKSHCPAILGTARKGANLDESFRRRIAKVSHYRSGASRGSNDWLGQCDALIVLGSPRVPPSAVRTRLIQAGNTAAAVRDGGWGPDYWSGLTTAGRRVTVKGLTYCDHDWHQAHRAIVRAELIQSVGRGRSILDTGLSVVVVSNENLDLPILPSDLSPLSDSALAVLHAVKRLTAVKSKGVADNLDNELTAVKPIYIFTSVRTFQ